MTSQFFLSVEQLTRRYDEVEALSAVSLGVREDELLVVVGPTGSGKTTLLRSLCGLDPVEEGRVVMEGVDITDQSPAERDLAMVFQNFSLYPRWTVRQNLSFPLKAPGRRLPRKAVDETVDKAAELLNISSLLDRPATRLSGGEMQRVAIGRAIVRNPRAYLLDEPLTNLDAKLRESLRVELVELRRKSGRPMIFVTHDQAEALSMADRIVVLENGQVLQEGSPQDVYGRPLSARVALQLGQPRINLFDGELSDGQLHFGGGLEFVGPGDEQPGAGKPEWMDMRRSGAQSGSRVTVGIRPESFELAGGQMPAVVHTIHYMGATSTLLARWAESEISVSVEGVVPCRVGDTFYPVVRAGYIWDR